VTPRGRSIIAYIATSADGYIARPDGDVAWLHRPAPAGDYGYRAFLRTIDTILWGRKTYAQALHLGAGLAEFGTGVAHYVFTRRPASPVPGVRFVSEAVGPFAQRLRATPGKHIWMMGGAELIAGFLDAGEIDEFVIHVIPIFIGEGIPLVAPRHRALPLALGSCRRFADGVVRLRYRVIRGG
jgi:dihydrofolate reductase